MIFRRPAPHNPLLPRISSWAPPLGTRYLCVDCDVAGCGSTCWNCGKPVEPVK